MSPYSNTVMMTRFPRDERRKLSCTEGSVHLAIVIGQPQNYSQGEDKKLIFTLC
jgi:hypothetical protein